MGKATITAGEPVRQVIQREFPGIPVYRPQCNHLPRGGCFSATVMGLEVVVVSSRRSDTRGRSG